MTKDFRDMIGADGKKDEARKASNKAKAKRRAARVKEHHTPTARSPSHGVTKRAMVAVKRGWEEKAKLKAEQTAKGIVEKIDVGTVNPSPEFEATLRKRLGILANRAK